MFVYAVHRLRWPLTRWFSGTRSVPASMRCQSALAAPGPEQALACRRTGSETDTPGETLANRAVEKFIPPTEQFLCQRPRSGGPRSAAPAADSGRGPPSPRPERWLQPISATPGNLPHRSALQRWPRLHRSGAEPSGMKGRKRSPAPRHAGVAEGRNGSWGAPEVFLLVKHFYRFHIIFIQVSFSSSYIFSIVI
jgi:hypothetical protein